MGNRPSQAGKSQDQYHSINIVGPANFHKFSAAYYPCFSRPR